jgi:hypothetical protein
VSYQVSHPPIQNNGQNDRSIYLNFHMFI